MNHYQLHQHTAKSLEVELQKTRLVLLENYLVILLGLGCPGLKWMFLRSWPSPEISTVPSATGNMKFPLLIGVITSFAVNLFPWISDASISSNSSISATDVSPFQIPPRVERISKEYTWQDFRTKLMQSRKVFCRNKVIFDHCSKRYYWSVQRHSEPPFIWSSHQTLDLECFADSSNIPWNPPVIRCPDRTVIAPQMSLLSLYVWLCPQSHLFPICVALTYSDSSIIPRKTCQIPRNCQRK